MLRTQFMGSVLFSLNVAHRAVIMYMLVFLQDVLRAEYGIPIDRLSRAFGMVFFRAKMGKHCLVVFFFFFWQLFLQRFPLRRWRKLFNKAVHMWSRCWSHTRMSYWYYRYQLFFVSFSWSWSKTFNVQHLDISYSNDSSALVLAAPVQSLLYKLIDPVYRGAAEKKIMEKKNPTFFPLQIWNSLTRFSAAVNTSAWTSIAFLSESLTCSTSWVKNV